MKISTLRRFCTPILWGWILTSVSAYAAEATTRAEHKPFPKPFSLQTKIISAEEHYGLSQLGSTGLTEYVVKPIPGFDASSYKTFDNSIVISINGGTLAPEMLQHVRKLVAERVVQSGFKLEQPNQAQAGIAAILSPFSAPSGKTTWELLLIVFDRKKFRELSQQSPASQGLDSVFKAAVRGIVVHLYPETDIDLKNGMRDEVTMDALRKILDRGFSYFMQPLASEAAATRLPLPSPPAVVR